MEGFSPATVMDGGTVRHGDDRNLIVEFYWKDKLNPQATEKQGRPIYTQVEYVHIFAPGDKTTDIHRKVRDSDKERFSDAYAQFQADQEQVADGTPLDELTILNVAQKAELRALGFRTVEHLAAMTEVQMDRVGMGARKIQRLAQSYIENAEGGGDSAKMVSEIERQSAEIESLKAQLKSALERLEEVSRSKGAEEGAKATSGAPEPQDEASNGEIGGGSALDDLPEPKPVAKKRGRPKKAA